MKIHKSAGLMELDGMEDAGVWGLWCPMSVVVVVFGSVFRIVYGHFCVDGGSSSMDGF